LKNVVALAVGFVAGLKQEEQVSRSILRQFGSNSFHNQHFSGTAGRQSFV
jgi:hypothetical protein